MSVAVQCVDCPTFYFPLNKEFSKKEIWKTTITIGRPVEEATESLLEFYKDCSQPNWDGYGANPVSKDSISEALDFIQLLPSSFPIPQILAEPSGEIGLEWYKDKKMIFAISFNGKGMITYAGIFGSNKTHGTEYFSDSIPSKIIENLRRLYT
ncbi:MAG: hypothetical protein KG029_03640 [Bacteroidetes bacterium]|jgi:hypothetical protein|nr:hypothetical protein [Bacteroidota bacterium]